MTTHRRVVASAAALVAVLSVCEPAALAQDAAASAPATAPAAIAPASASLVAPVLPMPPDVQCRLALVELESARADIDAARTVLAEAADRWPPFGWFGLGAVAAAATVFIVKETGVR